MQEPESIPQPFNRTDELLVVLIEEAREINRHLKSIRDTLTEANALHARANEQRRGVLENNMHERSKKKGS